MGGPVVGKLGLLAPDPRREPMEPLGTSVSKAIFGLGLLPEPPDEPLPSGSLGVRAIMDSFLAATFCPSDGRGAAGSLVIESPAARIELRREGGPTSSFCDMDKALAIEARPPSPKLDRRD